MSDARLVDLPRRGILITEQGIMHDDLTRCVAALPAPVRRIVCDLAGGRDEITRKAARAALSKLSPEERIGLTKEKGKVLVADLAVRMASVRAKRRYRWLRPAERTSPLAEGRAALAKRLGISLRDRAIFKGRSMVRAAAKAILPLEEAARVNWLFYEVEDGKVGFEKEIFHFSRERGASTYFYTVFVPPNWRSQTMHVGDGTGMIGSHLILSAALLASGRRTGRTIHEVLVLSAKTAESPQIGYGYVSSWPNGDFSLHDSFGSACDAPAQLPFPGDAVGVSDLVIVEYAGRPSLRLAA